MDLCDFITDTSGHAYRRNVSSIESAARTPAHPWHKVRCEDCPLEDWDLQQLVNLQTEGLNVVKLASHHVFWRADLQDEWCEPSINYCTETDGSDKSTSGDFGRMSGGNFDPMEEVILMLLTLYKVSNWRKLWNA